MIKLVGDVMLDWYDFCSLRDNPEHKTAPCYRVERSEYKPGGAGNVAANLKTLGANFEFLGVVGDDPFAVILRKVLDEFGISHNLLTEFGRITTVKERTILDGGVVSDDPYKGRKDRERIQYLEEGSVDAIFKAVINGRKPEAIGVIDYRKGAVSESLVSRLKELEIPMFVDTKKEHYHFYKGVYLIKPNSKEVREMTGLEDELEAAEKLRDELGARVLLTRGKDGASFFGLDGERVDFPGHNVKQVDVTGAGDVVLATSLHFFVKGYDLMESIRLANKAASISVQHVGCYTVSEREILG